MTVHDSAFVPVSRLELHSGVLAGPGGLLPGSDPHADETPRTALEAVLDGYLRAGPCAVQFSGGRDSSLVLALATAVARRRGSEPPEAIVMRYPGVLATDESQWQEHVSRALGVALRIVEVPPGGDELTSPFARQQMYKHGVGFTPVAAVRLGRLAAVAQGRTLLTGEGGDEVLGGSRPTIAVSHWRHRTVPSPAAAREMLVQAAPGLIRGRIERRRLERLGIARWLREGPRGDVLDALAADTRAAPWRWDAERWRFVGSRACEVGLASMARMASVEGFAVAHPLMAPRFVAALTRAGGALGFASRTEVISNLAGDLLPDDVVRRTSKARFNHVYAADGVRAFAGGWDGSGVDRDLVDVERLRAEWLSQTPTATSLIPLQLAVLAADGATP